MEVAARIVRPTYGDLTEDDARELYEMSYGKVWD